jgi:asparagine synthase (glutamine-hydrolysing)
MCGIAGYLSLRSPACEQTVKHMCDQVRHRGPDDYGCYVQDKCGLGMRRLSIVDLNTGHQPISNEDGSIWVVFNGEIYNHQLLRALLQARGHHFRTASDTEVLVHLYEEYGVDGLSKLRGMFAFAIWDNPRQSLLLVRDRFGKKPLYYAALSDGLWFGSELKCLKAAGVPLEIDPEAIKLYLRFTYIPDPYSAYRAIRKLPAGSWLIYRQGEVRQGRYWQHPAPAEHEPTDLTKSQATDRVREIFDESVRIRMMADVPLGAFLSGGIDSASVVASMSRQSPEPVKTFSIGFEEAEFNELDAAGEVARAFRTEHHAIIVKPDAAKLVHQLIRHFDEPFADSSALPTYVVSEFAAQHVKVALSGDGGDELFGGYRSFFETDRLRRYDAIPSAVKNALSALADVLPYSAYGKNFLRMISRETPLERYFERFYGPHYLLERLTASAWTPPADVEYLREVFADCLLPNGTDALLQAFYFETRANLTGDMLVKVDRMSMANSLEVRCPLLDHELAELASRFPPAWKMADGRGKRIFLDAVGDRLPAKLLTLPKKGFGVPLAAWFRGQLRELLEDVLLSHEALERGVSSPRFMRYLLDEHLRGRRDNSRWLWQMLILELWFRDQARPI